jgi:hypothetical protein
MSSEGRLTPNGIDDFWEMIGLTSSIADNASETMRSCIAEYADERATNASDILSCTAKYKDARSKIDELWHVLEGQFNPAQKKIAAEWDTAVSDYRKDECDAIFLAGMREGMLLSRCVGEFMKTLRIAG